LPWQHIW